MPAFGAPGRASTPPSLAPGAAVDQPAPVVFLNETKLKRLGGRGRLDALLANAIRHRDWQMLTCIPASIRPAHRASALAGPRALPSLSSAAAPRLKLGNREVMANPARNVAGRTMLGQALRAGTEPDRKRRHLTQCPQSCQVSQCPRRQAQSVDQYYCRAGHSVWRCGGSLGACRTGIRPDSARGRRRLPTAPGQGEVVLGLIVPVAHSASSPCAVRVMDPVVDQPGSGRQDFHS